MQLGFAGKSLDVEGGNSRSPLLSVCLPNHNYAPFLQQCLDSVREQTFTDFELIVVDDASTDDSVKIIRACADPRLRFSLHQRQFGAVATWNHCLDLVRGEFVAFLCTDDFFLPSKLEIQMGLFERDPALGLVHTEGYWADATGRILQLFSEVFPSELRDYLTKDHTTAFPFELRHLAEGYNYIHLSNAVFRRDAARLVGGFCPSFPYAADWDLWLRVAERYAIGYIAQPLSAYRRHARNLTLSMQSSGQELIDWYGVSGAAFKRWPPEAGDPGPVRCAAYRVIREHLMARVHTNYAAGCNGDVRRDLSLGFQHDPRLWTDSTALVIYLKSLIGGRRLKHNIQMRLGPGRGKANK